MNPILLALPKHAMRPTISCITTLATVMHLAFGCCLHAAHFEAAAVCCSALHVARHDCDCDCADEHRHAHESADSPGSASGTGPRVTDPDAAHHACDGCRCAATIEAQRTSIPEGPSTCLPVACDSWSLVRMQASHCPCGMARRPALSALAPPLFERLTV